MFFRTDLALELKEGGQSELMDVPCKSKRKTAVKLAILRSRVIYKIQAWRRENTLPLRCLR